jgi:caa(3)-type oxidase subunit IV
MSDTATAPAPVGDGHGHADAHHTNYVKIWGILLGLLVVSVVGPMIGIPILTLITAFGIALVKAYLVIKYFMHLTVEKKYVGFLLLTMLAFMLVFVGGVSPDVMKHEGQRWVNTAAKDVVEKGLKNTGEGHGSDAHPAAAPAPAAPPH